VVVEKTKEVYVSFNEMTINALEVVYATDGSHLFISCNRILNRLIFVDKHEIINTANFFKPRLHEQPKYDFTIRPICVRNSPSFFGRMAKLNL
jgi:hypothetical protein